MNPTLAEWIPLFCVAGAAVIACVIAELYQKRRKQRTADEWSKEHSTSEIRRRHEHSRR